ncbi:MAG: hypothetical protein KC620_26520, partial [Myxococcales bacterium]|nr:hypothetical protein [Myxococcales bacterium]
ARLGERVEIAVAVVEHEEVTQARLLIGREAHRPWTTVPMTPDGDFYFRADVPAALAAAGGASLAVLPHGGDLIVRRGMPARKDGV